MLDRLKQKRLEVLLNKFSGRLSDQTSSSKQTESDNSACSDSSDIRNGKFPEITASGDIHEGSESRTPDFVKHCVSAIVERPKVLKRIKQKKDGSPFAICYSVYNKNKRKLAALHSRGVHHTKKDFEKAIDALKEEIERLRMSREPRNKIKFEPNASYIDRPTDRRNVIFVA